MSTPLDITYAAHTQGCTFLLDSDGICRRIVLSPNNKRRDAARAASRCVGAQYVASLDPSAAGLLGEKPRVGASLLFARTDERGRISLVRTGHLTRFERLEGVETKRFNALPESPFESDEPLPSKSVETSAPPMPKGSAPRLSPRAADRSQPLRTAQFLQLRDDEDDDDDTTWNQPLPAPSPAPAATLREEDGATIRKSTMLPPALDAAKTSLSELARLAAGRRLPSSVPPPPPRLRSEAVPRAPRQVLYPLPDKMAEKTADKGGRRR